MVYNILKNLVYTGTLGSRKMKSCGFGSKKRVVNEPIIVEGTHEAIISKEDFELAPVSYTHLDVYKRQPLARSR